MKTVLQLKTGEDTIRDLRETAARLMEMDKKRVRIAAQPPAAHHAPIPFDPSATLRLFAPKPNIPA